MCTKNGKVYAIYAGMPRVSTLALRVKNDLLTRTETDIKNLNNLDALYNFMYELYSEEPPEDTSKILINSPKSLTQYAIFNSGYYPLYHQSKDLLLYTLDNNYVAKAIEDTPVLDYLIEKFSPFFTQSYFFMPMDILIMCLTVHKIYI